MNATNLASDIKIAWATVVGAAGSGLITFLEMIPATIGNLASIAGIVLSVVLSYTHFRRGRIEYEKTRLEISIMKEKEAERVGALERRREAGLPADRKEDVIP